jgi:hypothetical protein
MQSGIPRAAEACALTAAAVERVEAVNSLIFRLNKAETPALAVEKKKGVPKDSILREGKAILSIGRHLREALGKKTIEEWSLNLSNFKNFGRYAVMLKDGKGMKPNQLKTVRDGIDALYLVLVLGEGDRYLFDGPGDSNLQAAKRLVAELNGMRKTIREKVGKESAEHVKEMARDLDIADAVGRNIHPLNQP